MHAKEEIKKIMYQYSDRLINSMGDYVQCVIAEDWDNVAEQILTLLQPNDAGQPNESKPIVICRLYEIKYRSAYAVWDQRIATYIADTEAEAVDKFWANRNKENYEVMYVRQLSGI